MSLELVEPGESPVTDTATEPVLFVVDGHVLGQVSSVFEALPTDITAKWSLSSVDPQVDVQVVFAAEYFPALRAAEGLLSGLCFFVVLSLTLIGHLTDVLMTLQLSVPGESVVTEPTVEAFLPGVDRHVIRQVHLLSEAFRTEGAAVGFLSGVSPHVDLQVRTAAEDLPTF